jgi:membrane-bound lytic murein transglycosylase B
VKNAAGGALPEGTTDASLVRGRTRAFLAYGNYQALLAYNCSNSYALAVGLMADKIAP